VRQHAVLMMPASCAKAFAPTIGLLIGALRPMMS
jgi:hypothetical protein